jgi:hypothetical protein
LIGNKCMKIEINYDSYTRASQYMEENVSYVVFYCVKMEIICPMVR